MTATIHQALADKDLLPEEHLVDTAYVDAELILSSQQDYQLDLVGPVPPNPSWQTKDEQAYDLNCFLIDWDQQVVTCPQGHQSVSWQPHQTRQGTPMIAVKFSRTACGACAERSRCTKSNTTARGLSFRPKEQFLHLKTYIRDLVQEVLMLVAGDRTLLDSEGFTEIGMDSLMATKSPMPPCFGG